MPKSSHSAELAEINNPAPKPDGRKSSGKKTATNRRSVAATPEAEKDKSGDTSKSTLAQDVQDRAEAEATKARDAAAEQAEASAEQVKEAGSAFEPGSFAQEATNTIADNLSHVAQSVRETDLGSLQDDVTDFARRQPLLFFGGAALLGFAAARLMKASDRADEAQFDPRDGARSAPDHWGVS